MKWLPILAVLLLAGCGSGGGSDGSGEPSSNPERPPVLVELQYVNVYTQCVGFPCTLDLDVYFVRVGEPLYFHLQNFTTQTTSPTDTRVCGVSPSGPATLLLEVEPWVYAVQEVFSPYKYPGNFTSGLYIDLRTGSCKSNLDDALASCPADFPNCPG